MLDLAEGGLADWRGLAPASALPRRIGSAVSGALFAGVAATAGTAALASAGYSLRGFLWRTAAVAACVLVGAVAGAIIGHVRWRRTMWKLDARGLSVRRGWLWRTEVFIPRSRVQHLDLERGPIERHLGLASIVVHTAGTQTPALRQSGLTEQDAEALRDALIPTARGSDGV